MARSRSSAPGPADPISSVQTEEPCRHEGNGLWGDELGVIDQPPMEWPGTQCHPEVICRIVPRRATALPPLQRPPDPAQGFVSIGRCWGCRTSRSIDLRARRPVLAGCTLTNGGWVRRTGAGRPPGTTQRPVNEALPGPLARKLCTPICESSVWNTSVNSRRSSSSPSASVASSPSSTARFTSA